MGMNGRIFLTARSTGAALLGEANSRNWYTAGTA
jgi:hypothetical protein